jgi:hypothetical protein
LALSLWSATQLAPQSVLPVPQLIPASDVPPELLHPAKSATTTNTAEANPTNHLTDTVPIVAKYLDSVSSATSIDAEPLTA